MKVVFVYPSLADSGFKKVGKDTSIRYIHHGLSYLSSCAKLEGFDVSLIDLRTLTGWEEFSLEIARLRPDVVALTMMSPDYKYAMKAASLVKTASGDTKVIVGGIHPTIMPEEVAGSPDVDYVVRGEGEIALLEILKKIQAGSGLPEKVLTGSHVDVDKVPWIDRFLFDCLEAPFDYFLNLPFFTVMAGRGCSYNCRFCAPASKMVHGNRPRRRAVASVIGELESLRDKYGMKSFMFHDDCFTEDEEWVAEFCSQYRKRKFGQDFICQTRSDIICKNPDMIRLLAKTGLKMAMIGFESGNDRVLKFIGKGTSVQQNYEAARICKSSGIRIWALHMYGLPTETRDEALDTMKMIRSMRPYRSSAAFFTPHPGSYLYDYCKANGLSLIEDHDDFVALPEWDKPKIKGVDYEFLRKLAAISKVMPIEWRLRVRLDRIFFLRRNRRFMRLLRRLERENPGMHHMEILSMIKSRYPDV